MERTKWLAQAQEQERAMASQKRMESFERRPTAIRAQMNSAAMNKGRLDSLLKSRG